MDTALTDDERRAAKRALRQQALDARAGLADRAAREAAITAAIAGLAARTPEAVVAAYAAMGDEFDPLPGLRHHRGPIVLPVVVRPRQPLVFREWREGEAMDAGVFGTRHPPESAPVLRPQLVLCPLAGFDATGNRLGYGGGFYDRTLAALRAGGPVTAVGLAFNVQEVGVIPVEPTDERLDAIITEDGLRRFRDA
ncbi:5-formyltetrahydrofolate cyclo-ligase [Paracoccus sp. S-4012]|uniref:5-formyltetrahydrofolate cyclo-ligase n=1 Tax=Paracoccus sp. S-4012 TaxID=2665648 RepID=UPI0012B08CE4|nr:5-formyltetrahydrofolate cyclo-ligase [Paracoccus sp. S-4012]MRX51569.1 5-formyltetrahydrofolate cyclo-ligase [Paracoccus sp. S-4012]